jgi:hypothetical protein
MTSHCYSVLYYNLDIWNSRSLGHHSKQALMSAFQNAMRVCLHYQSPGVSFIDVHKITDRVTPYQVEVSEIALLLFKTFNLMLPGTEWIDISWN